MTPRAHHLHEQRLFDCYVALRGGEPLDPPAAEHLADCGECSARYADLAQFMDILRAEADQETDAVFTPERLRAQQQHIARRLDHIGHPARVIAFPGRADVRHATHVTGLSGRRWIAAAAAAGLFIGVGLGAFFDWEGARAPRLGPATAAPRQAHVSLSPVRPQPAATDVDRFLTDLEVAVERPHTRELLAFDALTPHVREVGTTLVR